MSALNLTLSIHRAMAERRVRALIDIYTYIYKTAVIQPYIITDRQLSRRNCSTVTQLTQTPTQIAKHTQKIHQFKHE